ncbi:hypothetical protein LVQ62_11050 [Allobranchiibius sp. GilTou73]|nr:hypothetical protein [Allobranchiibius sp. GilTou73]UIJ33696.1 hypothetical protein LVQ62_11050 [Allobranchiibius sp. GilTou73]
MGSGVPAHAPCEVGQVGLPPVIADVLLDGRVIVQFADNMVYDRVEEIFSVGNVAVERHHLYTQLAGDSAHRGRGNPLLVDEVHRGGDDLVQTQPPPSFSALRL